MQFWAYMHVILDHLNRKVHMGKSAVSMNWIARTKVSAHKSRGEVSLVEKAINDYVSTAYCEPKKLKKQTKHF